MRTATAVRTGLTVAVAVVLGLLVAPASHALWSVLVPSNAATIQAANFSVQLTGSSSNVTQEMVLPDGKSATLSLTGTQVPQLYPGTSAIAGVKITNSTNAGSDFAIRVSVPSEATISGSLVGNLSLSYGSATNLAGCATAIYGAGWQAVAHNISKGGSAVICFRVELLSSTPSSALGQSGAISISLQAAQIGRMP